MELINKGKVFNSDYLRKCNYLGFAVI